MTAVRKSGSHPCPAAGCDKAFSSLSHLRRHALKHEGRKDFTCKYCSRSFVRREVWQRHVGLHETPVSARPRIQPVTQLTPAPTGTGASQSAVLPSVSPTPLQLDLDYIGLTSTANEPPNILPQSHGFSFPPPVQIPDPPNFSPVVPVAAPFEPNFWLGMHDPWDFQVDRGIQDWLDSILATEVGATSTANVEYTGGVGPLTSTTQGSAAGQDYDDLAQTLNSSLQTGLVPACSVKLDGQRVNDFLTLFWSHFAEEYPILHRASFRIAKAPPHLVLSMILVASSSSDNHADRQLCRELLPCLRSILLSNPSTTKEHRLSTIQAMLMLCLAGRGFDWEEDCRSQAVLSFAFTLARRCNIYEDRYFTQSPLGHDLSAQWEHWITQESLRRVAWTAFLIDSQYATFFGQLPTRAESSFRQGIELPCNDASWSASTALQWSLHHRPGESMASALKNNLDKKARDGAEHAILGSKYARLVLTYGLTSLKWDVDRRDLIKVTIESTHTFILHMYAKLDANGREEDGPPSHLDRSLADTLFLAKLDILVNMSCLQVCAGAAYVGKLQPSRPTDRLEANKYMKYWLSTPDRRSAATLAANFLLQALQASTAPAGLTLTHGWALYMALLTLWASICLLEGSGALGSSPPRITGPNYRDHAMAFCREVCGGTVPVPGGVGMPSLAQWVVSCLVGSPSHLLSAAVKIIDNLL